MGTSRLLLTVLVLILFGGSTSAIGQTDAAAHPDLSGTWKLNVAKSKIPKGATPGSQTIYIDCMGSLILINVTGHTAAQSENFVMDGEQHGVAETSGSVLRSGGDRLIHLAYWKKSSLITETITLDVTDAQVAIPLSTSLERWTLSKDGVRLTRETGNQMRLLVYDKTN